MHFIVVTDFLSICGDVLIAPLYRWFISLSGVMKNGSVEVFFGDYGNREVVQPDNLRAMKPEFTELPVQAVQCSLEGVFSGEEGIWSEEDTNLLWRHVDVDKVVVEFGECDEVERSYSIRLYGDKVDVNEAYGQAVGKLSRSYKSSGPPPQPLPSGTSLTSTSQNRNANDNFAASSNAARNTWARGFEESDRKKQNDFPSQSRAEPRIQQNDNAWNEKRTVSTRSQDSGTFQQQPRSRFGSSQDNRGFERQNSRADTDMYWRKPKTPDGDGSRSGFGESKSPNTFGQGSRYDSNRNFGATKPETGSRTRPGDSWDSERVSPISKSASSSPSAATPLVAVPSLDITDGAFLDVIVVYAETPTSFWCQLKENATQLDKLMSAIRTEYTQLGHNDLTMQRPSTAQVCCVKYTLDDDWYRAKVLAPDGSGFKVLYVDYGNTESVEKDRMKLLGEEYLKVPFQAFHCSMYGVEPLGGEWSDEAIEKFQDVVMDKDIVACVVQQKPDHSYELEIIENNNPVHKQLLDAGLAKSLDGETTTKRRLSSASTSSRGSSSSRGNQAVSQKKKLPTLHSDRFIDVNVTYASSPDCFWLQLAEYSPALNAVLEKLPAGEDVPISSLSVKQECAALYDVDDTWYRAVVLQKHHDSVDVKFIDYGNEEAVNQVKRLDPQSLIDLPAQAIQCGLFGIKKPSMAEEWDDATVEYFESLVLDKDCHAKLIGRTQDGVSLIKLREGKADGEAGRNVSDVLIKEGMAQDTTTAFNVTKSRTNPVPAPAKQTVPDATRGTFMQIPVDLGKPYRVAMSWLTSSLDFHVQLERNAHEVNNITEELYEFYQKLKMSEYSLDNPEKGQSCVAYYAADGCWYRGKIIGLKSFEALVRYLDYGNKAVVPLSKVKRVDERFLRLPTQAVRCCLKGVSTPPKEWTDEAVAYFQEAVSEVFSCTFLSIGQDDLYSVEIQDVRGLSVSEEVTRILTGGKPASPALPAKVESRPMPVAQQASVPQAVTQPPSPERFGVNATLTVEISNIEGPHRFWCQKAEKLEALEDLLYKLEAKYSKDATSDKLPDSAFQVGSACVAKYSEDKMWYRSVITDLCGTNDAKVYFIDYGNSEKVSRNVVGALNTELASKMPAQAVECSLHGFQQSPSHEATEAFRGLTVDLQLTAKVKTSSGSVTQVELITPEGDDVLAKLNEKLGVAASVPASNAAVETKTTYPLPVFDTPEMEGFLAQVNSPTDFYVQLSSQAEELETFASQVQSICSNLGEELKQLLAPQVGTICAAKYSDGYWYRGQVSSITDNTATVLFVDYGNSDVCSLNELKVLDEALAGKPPYSLPCKLDVATPAGGWSTEQIAAFHALSEEGEKAFMVRIKQNTSPYTVQLLDEDKDVAEALGEAPPATDEKLPAELPEVAHFPAATPLAVGARVFLSHFEDPNDLYLHLVDHTNELDTLMTKLGELQDPVSMSTVAIGEACAAVYPVDEAWYRAVVTNRANDSVDVHYVDYGNSGTVTMDQLTALPQQLLQKPSYAYHCSLSNLREPVGGWPADLLQKLESHVESSTEFTITALESGDLSSVKLTDGSEDLSATLQSFLPPQEDEISEPIPDTLIAEPEAKVIETGTEPTGPAKLPDVTISEGTHKVSVIHVEHPGNFFIHLRKDAVREEEILNQMEEEYSSMEETDRQLKETNIGALCAVKSIEHGVWYRGKIVAGDTDEADVQYVDYGNLETVPKTALKALSETLCGTPPLALECYLDGADPTADSFSDEAIDQLITLTEGNIITAEVLGCSLPLRVKLFDKETDVNAAVLSAGEQAQKAEMGEDAEATVASEQTEKDKTMVEGGDKDIGDGEEVAVNGKAADEQEDEEQQVDDSEERREKDQPDMAEEQTKGEKSEEQTENEEVIDLEEGDIQEKQDTEQVKETAAGLSDVLGVDFSATETKPYPRPTITQQAGVYVSSIVSPAEFYIQLTEHEMELEDFTQRLSTVYAERASEIRPLDNIETDVSCCAKSQEDGQWYRASVLDTDADLVTVKFVDYGNIEAIPKSDICKLYTTFWEKPPFSMCCQLAQSVNQDCSDEITEKFSEQVLEQELQARVLSEEEPYTIQLLDGDENLFTNLFPQSAGDNKATENTEGGATETDSVSSSASFASAEEGKNLGCFKLLCPNVSTATVAARYVMMNAFSSSSDEFHMANVTTISW